MEDTHRSSIDKLANLSHYATVFHMLSLKMPN